MFTYLTMINTRNITTPLDRFQWCHLVLELNRTSQSFLKRFVRWTEWVLPVVCYGVSSFSFCVAGVVRIKMCTYVPGGWRWRWVLEKSR